MRHGDILTDVTVSLAQHIKVSAAELYGLQLRFTCSTIQTISFLHPSVLKW